MLLARDEIKADLPPVLLFGAERPSGARYAR